MLGDWLDAQGWSKIAQVIMMVSAALIGLTFIHLIRKPELRKEMREGLTSNPHHYRIILLIGAILILLFVGVIVFADMAGLELGIIIIGFLTGLAGRAVRFFGLVPFVAGFFTSGPLNKYGAQGVSIHHPQVVSMWDKLIFPLITTIYGAVLGFFAIYLTKSWLIMILGSISYVLAWLLPYFLPREED